MEEENWQRLFKSGLMMFKSTVIYLISTLWIGSWGLFAVDEVSSTISHLVEKHKTQISSVLKPGYVMHEKNGVKFMIKQETADAMGPSTRAGRKWIRTLNECGEKCRKGAPSPSG